MLSRPILVKEYNHKEQFLIYFVTDRATTKLMAAKIASENSTLLGDGFHAIGGTFACGLLILWRSVFRDYKGEFENFPFLF